MKRSFMSVFANEFWDRESRKKFSIAIPLLLIFLSACTFVDLGTPIQTFGNGIPTQIRPSPSEQLSIPPTTRDEVSAEERWDSLCPSIEPAWVVGFDVYQTPAFPEPVARQPFLDPIFGTCIVRVTDRKMDISSDDPSQGLKNEYSRVQSFNCDGTLFLLYGTEGSWYLYNSATLSPLQPISIGVEPRWDSTDPNILYFIDETRLMKYNVSTGEQKILHDFALDFPGQPLSAVWTRYEGSPSLDSRYWGLMAEDKDWLTIAYLIYDLREDRVLAVRELQKPLEVDSVTISPLGNYFLAYLDEYCDRNQLGNDPSPCGLMVYNRDLQDGRGLLRIVGHSDLALDSEGKEVLVYQDIDTDHITILDLASGNLTPLWPIDFTHSPIGLHFSGRGYNLPGWVLVSTYSGAQPTATWMDDQIFALELKPGGRVVRFAHTHSLVDENLEHDYWAEPHATVDSDFTRILFTSNWGRSGTGEVDTYWIQLPQDWETNLP